MDGLEAVLKRNRLVALAGVAGITALAWIYLLAAAAEMGGMTGGTVLADLRPWSVLDFLLMFLMWAVMMVAMMVPSAAPMILLFAAISRKQRAEDHAIAPTGAFLAGYIVVWSAFSLAATSLQWALEQAALLSATMVSTSPFLGGLLLIAAGLYQWTPLKNVCLRHCRSPLHFILKGWKPGAGGAFAMGLEHGAFCVGCCWVLMGLLFVGGVMNLLWIAAIAVFVLIEKLLPLGPATGRVGGLFLGLAGLAVIVLG